MRKDTDRTREEKLLEAIGNLPEDMIAQAAEYSPHNREGEQVNTDEEELCAAFDASNKNVADNKEESWIKGHIYLLYRGLAMAACFAFVVCAGYFGGKMFRNYADKEQALSIKTSGTDNYASGNVEQFGPNQELAELEEGEKVSGKNDTQKEPVRGLADEEEIEIGLSDVGIQLWTNAEWYQELSESEDEDGEAALLLEKTESSGKEMFDEGKTIALTVSQTENEMGESISVITLGIEGKESETYLLHSQTSNCRFLSIANGGTQRELSEVDLLKPECISGDVAELAISERAVVSWEEVIVPEWSEMEITVLDIIDIYRSADGEEGQLVGEIVIGKSGEEYFGTYQAEE